MRERCEETESTKAVRVWRHELGNVSSVGSTGEYHHLQCIRRVSRDCTEDILDIVTNDCIRQLRQRSGRVWLEVGVIERLARVQLDIDVVAAILLVLAVRRPGAPPVEHPLCYVGAQLPPPGLGALSWRTQAVAVMRLPGRMQHDAAYNAHQNQAEAAKYEIGACAESGEAGSERLIARSRQEAQCAVGQGLHVQGGCAGLLGLCVWHCRWSMWRHGGAVGVRVMVRRDCGVGRARGCFNDVAHGGWMFANIGPRCAKKCPGLHQSMVQCDRLDYVASP